MDCLGTGSGAQYPRQFRSWVSKAPLRERDRGFRFPGSVTSTSSPLESILFPRKLRHQWPSSSARSPISAVIGPSRSDPWERLLVSPVDIETLESARTRLSATSAGDKVP
jgi:hypothetical protein